MKKFKIGQLIYFGGEGWQDNDILNCYIPGFYLIVGIKSGRITVDRRFIVKDIIHLYSFNENSLLGLRVKILNYDDEGN